MKKLLLLMSFLLTQQTYTMLDRIREENTKLERQVRKQETQGGVQRVGAIKIREEKKIDIPAKGKKLNMALIDAVALLDNNKASKPGEGVAVVKAYLNAGADVDWTDKNDRPFSARELSESYTKTQPTPDRLAIRKLIRAIGGERLAQELMQAIKNGKIDEVEKLIKKGANPKLSVKGKDAWAVLQSEEVLKKVDSAKRDKINKLLKNAQ